MSDEMQQYSIANQKAAIQEYASRNGFLVVQTYSDSGRSGVVAKHRAALQQLLKDVVNGNTAYRVILVYDVSRWGRFQDSDEAAHYEFLCKSAGVPVHYCAEPFANDGTASSSILKALKRSMAAEFSRELGVKVFRGKSRLVEMGFWVGAAPGYGYRRMMVSADGKPKQVLNRGECKSLTTDRVVLVLGPVAEVECVRRIFSLAVKGMGCTAIARNLNEAGIEHYGKPWGCTDVHNIVSTPKYAGYNVWNRGSARLRSKRVPVSPEHWIIKKGAFPPIVDQDTFDNAQSALPRRADSLWSDDEILSKLRRLLAAKGRLSERLIVRARGMPATSTLHNHLGSFRNAYKLIGYNAPEEDLYGCETSENSMRLRRRLVARLRNMFPNNVSVTHLPNRGRSILRIDDAFMVSIVLCPIYQARTERPHWVIVPNPAERDFITLLCRLNRDSTRAVSYHMFPKLNLLMKTHRSRKGDPWLCGGTKFENLSDFYSVVRKVWHDRQEPDIPALGA